MSNEWAEMLRSHDIGPEDADAATMARVKPSSLTDSQVIDLSGYSVIEVTGDDAATFLQGQFCNDLKQVTSTHAQITGYCTPKGRLLALPTIVGFAEGFRLLVPQSVKDAFIKRLSMFVMRSQVSIQESVDVRCVGIIADAGGANDIVKSLAGAVPASTFDVVTSQLVQLIRWHDDHVAQARPRFIVLADTNTITDLWNHEGDISRAGHSRWRLADISAGVPSVTGGVVEAFVPQMINLQLLEALSFTKGCYPGQEIVARMHYLGKLKRHMRLFKLPLNAVFNSDNLVAGAKLSCGDDQEAAVVVDAAQAGDEAVFILAVAKVSANEGTLRFEESDLVSADLPYELPSLLSDEPKTD